MAGRGKPANWTSSRDALVISVGRGWVAIGSLYSTDSQPGSLDEYLKPFP